MYCRKPGSRWNEANFSTWEKHDFEEYYPAHFTQRATEVLALSDRHAKRTAKKALLDEVREWCDKQTEDDLRSAFSDSAGEVIEKLRVIEAELFVR